MQLHSLRLILLVLSLGLYAGLRADDSAIIAAVRAADDERLAATIAADAKRLDAIFSSELRYAHSSGKIDTKASYTDTLVTHTTIYRTFEYVERNFRPIAPGVVLMTGRVKAQVSNGGKENQIDLNFLAVWREENGHWRFLAWQSCKNPPPEPAPPLPPLPPVAPSNLKASVSMKFADGERYRNGLIASCRMPGRVEDSQHNDRPAALVYLIYDSIRKAGRITPA